MILPLPLLVIDDDAALRKLLCSVLAAEGYHLAEACDGHEALLVLQQSPVAMVALCDYCMLRLDGLQLLGALTLGPPALRRHEFILMTANSSQLTAAERRLLRQRSVALLSKPFAIDTLLQTVAAAVARIEGHAQQPIQRPKRQQAAAATGVSPVEARKRP